MFTRSSLLIVAVAILGAALGLFVSTRMNGNRAIPAPPGVTVLGIGDTRADLELADLDGRRRRLSEFDGRLVLLNFWATWCGPCREEMPLLDRAGETFPQLQVVGIAIDDVQAVRRYLRAHPVRYPVLIGGEDEDASLRFGDTASVLPYSVLIGRDGKLLARRAGYFTEAGLRTWLAPFR